MTEDIKGLIEKIQKEGIVAAENKAREIEAEAIRKAEEIIAKAKVESARLLKEAKDNALRTEDSTKAALKQAGRDLLLVLKEEVNDALDKLISAAVRNALTPQELSEVISGIIHNLRADKKGDIIVALSDSDKAKLEDSFLGRLKEELKKGIVFKGSDEISGGFVISFDQGKSQFDFTDKALADYLGNYLKPRLARIFKDVRE